MYHLRKAFPQWSGAQTGAARAHLREAIGGGLVADFEVPANFTGRDPHDAHVHGAAVAARSDILLTNDRREDFSADPDSLPYEIWRADDFFVHVDDIAPSVVRRVTERQVDYWFRRNGEVDLPGMLRKAEAPLFADRVRRHLQTF